MVMETRQKSSAELRSAVDEAIIRTQEFFLKTQYPEGYWWGELESNATMEAEYLLMTYFLSVVEPKIWRKIVRRILKGQGEDGGWAQYYGGPGDLSTTAECYFALKLAWVLNLSEVGPHDPPMERARAFCLQRGGIPFTRVFTKIWLALFGEWPWEGIPVLPPELIYLPPWFPFNIYDFSSWSRETIVPITILMARRPICPLPEGATLDELLPEGRASTDFSIPKPRNGLWGWSGFFYLADKALHLYERLPWKPGRERAIRRAAEWVIAHQEADGGWGGIQPPWVYSLMALKALGYSLDHPIMRKGIEGWKGFLIEEGDEIRVQACVSPVWDTCLALIALVESGIPPDHPALVRAGEWLLTKQILRPGDWAVKVKGVEPGGWPFEFANDWYPDVDDTAEVIIALHLVRLPDEGAKHRATERGIRWVLGMQSKNGGWAAFDRDNTRTALAKIPFADFGEALDPPSVDVTAHVVECLGRLGYDRDHPAVRKALDYIYSEQELDGPWFGRWGVNYIYGTGAVLPALEAIDEAMDQPRVRRAVEWLLSHQNSDGGWGESCASYADPSLKGQGPSTASQTAWALMALLSAGKGGHPAVERGIRFLLETQQEDGTWDEPYFTGAGFPGYGTGERLRHHPQPSKMGLELPAGFMINYHLYRNYWPLTALGRYRQFLEGQYGLRHT